jgi:leucyl aminopeptidase
MQVHVSNDAATSVATGALVVPVFAGGAVDGVAAEVDRVLGGAIADVIASGEIAGKPNETSLVHAKDTPFKRVLVVGLGERDKFTASALAKYAGTAVRHLGKRGVK